MGYIDPIVLRKWCYIRKCLRDLVQSTAKPQRSSIPHCPERSILQGGGSKGTCRSFLPSKNISVIAWKPMVLRNK
ncbi:hypothetical protein J6590_091561 [Homalodisca vitripennis]|nr:hypothetical protein J6590_091561 [Homalodisca vitripennis]